MRDIKHTHSYTFNERTIMIKTGLRFRRAIKDFSKI